MSKSNRPVQDIGVTSNLVVEGEEGGVNNSMQAHDDTWLEVGNPSLEIGGNQYPMSLPDLA